jgi:DnaJ-class molecular chaperone
MRVTLTFSEERTIVQLRFFDHYRLLDVDEDATPADIRRAYAKAVDGLPHRWIDRFTAGLAGRTADAYRVAYEELSDAEKREKYDQYLAQGRKMIVSILH